MANIRAADRIKTAHRKLRKAETPEEKAEIRNKLLRTVSKSVQSADPLVNFLYGLARDQLAIGDVEKQIDIAEDICNQDPVGEPITYTNGFLANWAEVAAQRLRALDPAPAVEEKAPEPPAEDPKPTGKRQKRNKPAQTQETGEPAQAEAAGAA